MGHKRTLLWLFDELANGREYRNHHCNLSHGLCDPECQNRDGLVLQVKIDEIIRAVGTAHNEFIDLEDRSHDELDEIKAQFASVAVKARKGKGRRSTRVAVK